MGSLTSKPKTQSAEDLQAERDKMAAQAQKQLEADAAKKKTEDQAAAVSALKEQETKRAAFAGKLKEGVGEDNSGRKKFLKGV